MKRICGVAVLAALGAATCAFGAGYGIYEGSARANAMGAECTADPVSPSVLYENAAAMTELEGTQVELGLTMVKPKQSVVANTPAGKVKAHGRSHWWYLPTMYVTHPLNDRLWLGVGGFTRIGLGAEYPKGWAGRYGVQKAEILSYDVNPSLALKVTENFSLAAGLQVEYFDFELCRAIPMGTAFVDPDAMLKITGDNYGLGYNAGAYWKATDWLAFGLSYEGEIEHHVKGDYKLYTDSGTLQDGSACGDFPSPGRARLGTSVKPFKPLTIDMGIVYTLWECYDSLDIDFNPALFGRVPQSSSKKNWHDAWRYQIGFEYALNEMWALRCGYVMDKTPDPDYLLDYMVPTNDRHLWTFGLGWKKDDLRVDLGYTMLIIMDRTVKGHIQDGVWDGTFENGNAHMASVSVGYRF